jgi:hypothetical protein
MKKQKFLFLIFCLVPIFANGQIGYILKDSSLRVKKIIWNGGHIYNEKFCKVRDNDQWTVYSPYQISEYALSDGSIYISREIQINDSTERVFLNRLFFKSLNPDTYCALYFFKEKKGNRFFLEKDSLLKEITRSGKNGSDFRKQLAEFTSDCPEVKDDIRVVNYKKSSLKAFTAKYTDCTSGPFPHFRYGVNFGFNAIKLFPKPSNYYYTDFDFKYDAGYLIGLFADNPIVTSDFSWHLELYFSKHGMSYHTLNNGAIYDYVANLSSLKLPLLIRYTFKSNSVRPIINLGGAISYGIENENIVYQTKISGGEVELVDLDKLIFENVMIGPSMGAGLEYIINNRHSLFFEIRYNKYYSINHRLKVNEWNLTTGINL